MSSQTIEWRIDAASSRSLRAVVYVVVGLFGGGMLLALCGMAFLSISLALGGEYKYLAYSVLLALIGGPLSLLYLWPMIVDGDQRPPLAAAFASGETAERYAGAFTRGRLLGAVIGGVLALLVALALDPRALFVLVVGALFLIPFASGVISWGRVDPEEATLAHRDRTVALSRVEGIRRVDVGGVSLCRLSYRPGAGDVTSPRLLAASPEAADAIERMLAMVDPVTDEEYAPDRAVRAALGSLALCFLGLAGALLVVEPGNAVDPGLRWYLVVSFGTVGGLFALAALFSG